MRIIATYTDKDIGLEGSGQALSELAEALGRSKGGEVLPLFVPSKSPSPFDGYARLLKLQHNTEFACISRVGDEVLLSGSPEKLALLGTNIGWFAEQHPEPTSCRVGDHMHIEFYPGHFFLKKESIPLVVTRCGET